MTTPTIRSTPPRCDSSLFDRSLCFCVDGGVMHTYSCTLPADHLGDHRGLDSQHNCGPCVWTNNEVSR